LRDTAPLGAPCWIDIFSSDIDRIIDFYGEILGWTGTKGPEEYGGYVIFDRDGVPVAGGMTNDGSTPNQDHWTVYLATEDIGATAARITAAGGTLPLPPVEVPGQGWMLVANDTGGATIAAWQAAPFPGFGVIDEHGAPSWFELHTRDHGGAVAFYEQVFDWVTHPVADSDEFRYTTLGEGEGQLAGIMDASSFLPAGAPDEWYVYFSVADVDAALARVVELGGAVVHPAEDTPYGRLATATDPTGSTFKLRG
jgi:uncharacterized protein